MTIKPNCLRVDKATTFLASVSTTAAILAANKVKNPKTIKTLVIKDLKV
jgi:hypothetical protein